MPATSEVAQCFGQAISSGILHPLCVECTRRTLEEGDWSIVFTRAPLKTTTDGDWCAYRDTANIY